MGISGIVVRYIVIGCALFLSACGGGGGGDDGGSGTTNAPPPPPPQSGIGPAGGTVDGPNGTKVVIPPGALAVNTPIAITQIAASAVPLPSGITPIGATFAFTPHGTTFAVPVTVTLPFDPASVPAGSLPQFMKTNAQNQWQDIANPVFGATSVSGQVTSFSDLMTGLLIFAPRREWEFSHIPGDHGKAVRLAPPNHGGKQPEDVPSGRSVSDIVEFGPALFDEPVTDLAASLLPDQIANGHAFGSGNGVTYGVLAEAPDGVLNGPDPIGSKTNLVQRQTFKVTAANPTLRVKLTKVRILLTDFNGTPGPTGGIAPIKGEVIFNLSASKGISAPFLLAKGHAHVFGADNNFFPRAANLAPSTIGLWSEESFNRSTGNVGFSIVNGQPTLDPLGTVAPGSCPGTFGLMELKATIPIEIPISTFIEGDVLNLRSEVTAEAYNRRGGGSPLDCAGSSASAFIRDPLEIGGVEWEFTGLEAVETSAEDNFEESPRLEPEVCKAGPSPNPEAGTLQFEASTFTVDEFEGAVQAVAVTRTGGSTGAISATFTTSDGTATAGSDYQALNTTVFFADGQEGVQIVPIPVTPDLLAELDETVNMTLSELGGCGALGARTTAVMTILDNRVNTPSQPSGLDPTFDTDGKVTTNFGGNDTGMAIQPDGKIVMVGGSTSDFVMARYNTNGSLDTSFGTNGLVTHNMLTGTAEEIARAVAIQSDGKIIVAGHTGQFGRPGRPAGNRFDHAVVRYNANGSVDTTFGAGGVASALIGRIFAMALQPDGGIIVVGDAPQPEDMMVARYNPNGNLDLTFGEGGFRLFDFDLTAELAENVAVQSNGSIVLSGPHTKVGETVREQHTAVIRLDAGGDPDDSFGADGVVILDNLRVSDGVAIQSDGRVVLVGDTDGASANAPRFATTRLNTNGTPDNSFGTGGTVVTDITTRGDTARSVALQADGKIVVAGSSNNQVNPNFAAVRYNANGTPDASFATASILSVDFFGFTDSAENVAIQGDGKIVLGGLARNAVDGYGLARVNP